MSPNPSGRILILWGRGLLVGGTIGALASAAPELLLSLVPGFDPGFLGVLSALLLLSVTPLMVLAASAGAILLLAGQIRRRLDR